MKHAVEYITGESSGKKKRLSKKYHMLLLKWSKEAHEIDPSKPMKYFYAMFLGKLRDKYKDKECREKFFKKQVIEV